MSLAERKIIVTGGPTREWIDPVRYISNASSGKMGIALAREAAMRSRTTVFIHGPIAISPGDGAAYRTRAVESTVDLLEAVNDELCAGAVLVMAAAPADYTPVGKSPVKIKKHTDTLSLELVKTPDILRSVSARRESDPALRGLFVAGFAAETNDTEANALAKLSSKNLDLICLNDVTRPGAGFGTDTNAITLFTRRGARIDLPLMCKDEAAKKILDQIEAEIEARDLGPETGPLPFVDKDKL